MAASDYTARSYGGEPIGFGDRPGIVVIDFQKAFTESKYPLGGAPLVMRALANTATLLAVARRQNIPVASCYTAYNSPRNMPHWKVGMVREQFLHGHPCTALDPAIHDRDYDVVVCKTGPSIFFQTPVVPYFVKERVDTVIITGCITSGCVRASTIDAFQNGLRTMVPEDCVGDHEGGPHRDNLRDVGRRYADIVTAAEVLAYFEDLRKRNRGGDDGRHERPRDAGRRVVKNTNRRIGPNRSASVGIGRPGSVGERLTMRLRDGEDCHLTASL